MTHTCIDLCAGCGGLSIGFEHAGISSLALIESNKTCCETLKSNRPFWNVMHAKIEDVDHRSIALPDCIVAGIPCQPYSTSGKRKGLEDERGKVYFAFKDYVSHMKPKVFVIENVKGLMNQDNGRTFAFLKQDLEDMGYTVLHKILNAVDFEVAQKRERLFIVGVRADLDATKFAFPTPSSKKLVLRDVILDINTPDKNVGAVYPAAKKGVLDAVPEGGCWVNLPVETQRAYLGKAYESGGGKRGFAKRLSMAEPAPTLTTSPMQKQTERCHPLETRPLTVREYARIQSFPDDWMFSGGVSQQYKQIGNAVPPTLAFAIGKSVAAFLDDIKVLNS